MLYSKNELARFEQAIGFLVSSINDHCVNEKPVILHSLRVGLKLMDEKQATEIIIAGFLHDLVEDSNVSVDEIKKKFGAPVAKLVDVNSFDKTITDYRQRWGKAIAKICAIGKPAMIIKIADNLDNLPYYWRILNSENRKKTFWKHQYTIAQFTPKMKNNKLFQAYIALFRTIYP